MWFFLSVVVICGTVIYLSQTYWLEKAKRVARIIDSAKAPEIPASAPTVPEVEPIPVDLMNLALMESEDWAKQSALKAMYDMYERTRDWGVVRAAYNPTPDSIIN